MQEKKLPKLVNVTRGEQKRLVKEEQSLKSLLRERMLILPTMVRMKISIPRPNQNLSRKPNYLYLESRKTNLTK